MDDSRLDALGQTVVAALPGAAIGHSVAFGQLTVAIDASKFVEVARFSRVGWKFDRWLDVVFLQKML